MLEGGTGPLLVYKYVVLLVLINVLSRECQYLPKRLLLPSSYGKNEDSINRKGFSYEHMARQAAAEVGEATSLVSLNMRTSLFLSKSVGGRHWSKEKESFVKWVLDPL
jgi:hypothetical protein